MNSNNFMESIIHSEFVQAELPVSVQLGMPYIKKGEKNIILVFSPHIVWNKNGRVYIYSKSYELEIEYPSGHIAKFITLTDCNPNLPIKYIDEKWMVTNGRIMLDSVFDACKEVLAFYDEHSKIPNFMVEKYNDKLIKTAELLGITVIYGGDVQ